MAVHPILALGVLAGLAAGAIVYFREKRLKGAAIAATIGFLAVGTPLHFIILPVLAGYHINNLLNRRLDRNWAAFLVSLIGLPVIFVFLQATGRLYLALSAPGPLDLGGALAVAATLGVLYAALVVAGTASYLLASLYASFRRRQRPPGIKS
jgi:hypothetical protein